jgi:hypothetical protein
MIRTTELGEVLVRFEHPFEICCAQSVHFDLNPYALQVLSDIRPGAMFFLLVGAGSGQNTTRISLDQAIDLALAHNHSSKPREL